MKLLKIITIVLILTFPISVYPQEMRKINTYGIPGVRDIAMDYDYVLAISGRVI